MIHKNPPILAAYLLEFTHSNKHFIAKLDKELLIIFLHSFIPLALFVVVFGSNLASSLCPTYTSRINFKFSNLHNVSWMNVQLIKKLVLKVWF